MMVVLHSKFFLIKYVLTKKPLANSKEIFNKAGAATLPPWKISTSDLISVDGQLKSKVCRMCQELCRSCIVHGLT